MHTRKTSSDNRKRLLKSAGPCRFHPSDNSTALVQSTGTSGPTKTSVIAPPVTSSLTEEGKEPSEHLRHEDVRMLMDRHKKTLKLLAE
ncbi:MAG: hypothetical protein U9Q97_05425 [Acidobacteriota bacterium]|nr:hypothetical protein [Acidobacteriota bacterium]